MKTEVLKLGLNYLEQIQSLEKQLSRNIACGDKVMFVNQHCIDTFGLEKAKKFDSMIWMELQKELQPKIDNLYKMIEDL